MQLPKHACGLTIRHNDHKASYNSVEQDIERFPPAFKSEQDKARCIATDELWEMQWYPDTPIGFYHIAAPTLEELLAFALEFEK